METTAAKKDISIVFVSSILSHHQASFCRAMIEGTGGNFTFVSTEKDDSTRYRLTEEDAKCLLPCILDATRSDKMRAAAIKETEKADVVLFGNSPNDFLKARARTGKLSIFMSERFFKGTRNVFADFLRRVKYFFRYKGVPNSRMLCLSAYTYSDVRSFFCFKNRAYRFGYFPETKKIGNYDSFFSLKNAHQVVWAGRLIEWKRPDFAVRLIADARNKGVLLRLKLVGEGPLLCSLKGMSKQLGVAEQIDFVGPVDHQEVRTIMEQSTFFVMTSDSNEGWGAVLNEAMDSGCVCVANCQAGAAQFLIRHGENGFLFDDDYKKFLEIFFQACARNDIREISERAHQTTSSLWNGRVAAARLLKAIKTDFEISELPNDGGPLSLEKKKER